MTLQKVSCISILLAAGALAMAQPPAPQPAPAPQAMPAQPLPPLPPLSPAPPTPAAAPYVAQFGPRWDMDVQEKIQDAMEKVREKMAGKDFDYTAMQADMQEQMERAREQVERARENVSAMKFDFKGLNAPMAFAQNMTVFRHNSSEASLYDSGKRSLDERRWDQALDRFTEVAARGGSHADGALYWKAYTLNKLGRRDEALAAIAELRKSYAGSHWLDDAKALEVEVKQASGTAVAPESQNDDEIKLLALNGLMQSDPDRAFPILERLLKSAQAPSLKKRALFVLAESSAPRAQQLLEQIARGNGNPDLQLQAINYMSASGRRQGNNAQVLAEIYASSGDVAVKRAVLNALAANRDKPRVLEIARTEKNQELRLDAIHMLAGMAAQAEMWQLYQAETSPDVKQQILLSMAGAGNSDKLLDVARSEKDPKLRRSAIQGLSAAKTANVSDALVGIYGGEQDQQVKRSIIGVLYSQRNVKGLVELGRKEHDVELKKFIIRSLVDMKSPEATSFLEEILK